MIEPVFMSAKIPPKIYLHVNFEPLTTTLLDDVAEEEHIRGLQLYTFMKNIIYSPFRKTSRTLVGSEIRIYGVIKYSQAI